MSGDEFTVRKYAATMPVSCCVLTDSTGVNHCEHPPPPPISRWRSLRWNLRNWWDAHRPHIHLGPCDTEDDW